ncbi:hypothetical protein KP509_09G006400 [Ceratopteris richardii]|uniref:SET domain-containing protein n=1 Tax=Ceratopteris richardii TaxID=49495 RepID=A0A8T2U7N4_CERRI|nr:hypothetical protein KP509_09G006400 [Ceratopteris richardii]
MIKRKRQIHAVKSRAWGIDEENTTGLVPFVDFLNHDARCQSFLSFDNELKYAEVFADRDYGFGEQVFINYGKYGNDALATMFGFTLESNPYDQVEFWIGPSENDVLWKLRSELLQSHGMPILRRDGVSNDTGSYFVIKKVRNITGQGKGIPQSLRAFARVLCADSKEELIYLERMASEGDGRLAREAFKDKRKELQAMLLLLTHLNALIEDYISALSALGMAQDYEDRKRQLISVRQEMVNNILEGELTILHSAADWLRHYCLGLDSLS